MLFVPSIAQFRKQQRKDEALLDLSESTTWKESLTWTKHQYRSVLQMGVHTMTPNHPLSELKVEHLGKRSSNVLCRVQVTLFADGEPHVKPLVIFWVKVLQIPLAEKVQYDSRATVTFQPSVWCDESTMAYWITRCWKPKMLLSTLLVAYVHHARLPKDSKNFYTSTALSWF